MFSAICFWTVSRLLSLTLIARYIYEEFEKKMKVNKIFNIAVKRVDIYETDSSMASYYKIDWLKFINNVLNILKRLKLTY